VTSPSPQAPKIVGIAPKTPRRNKADQRRHVPLKMACVCVRRLALSNPWARKILAAATITTVQLQRKQFLNTSCWLLAGPKIYTKTGDGGTSSLFTGERRTKNDPIFDALGATDELSSQIAVAREHGLMAKHPYTERLRRVQCILQDVASTIATPASSAREAHTKRVFFSDRHVKELEEWIDEYSNDLPPLQNFILPGGGHASAALHVARTVCRRAERAVSPLVKSGETDKQALIYLNRLSDFLFTAARYAAKLDLREETIYLRPE